MKQKRFTKEFEEEAVRLLRTSGRTKREIGADLGVSLSTLTRWLSERRDREGSGTELGAIRRQRSGDRRVDAHQ
jgi:transposase